MKVAIRGSRGLSLVLGGPPGYGHKDSSAGVIDLDRSNTCKVLAFSADGDLLAWCNGSTVKVARVGGKDNADGRSSSFQELLDLPVAKRTVFLSFSPKGTHLATWEVYAVVVQGKAAGNAPADAPASGHEGQGGAAGAVDKKPAAPQAHNFRIWDLSSGEMVYCGVQRAREGWCPQWTLDEAVCCLRSQNNEALFYENNQFGQPPRARLSLPKLSSFSMSSNSALSSAPGVVGFLPGQKGGPGFAKMFTFPNFHPEKDVVATKSFMTCDRVETKWSANGRCALLLATSDVDKTGQSYYGKTQLHYLDTTGEGAMVPLAKEGPIYSVEWSPVESNFVVVYGYMPAKATVFSSKCQLVAEFGMGPRNLAMFNPQGNLLYLGGFGNLSGQTEVWDLTAKRKLTEFTTTDATDVRWAPDGQHLLASTCAPRLRQNNGYSLWHYTGSLMLETRVGGGDTREELWEAAWQPGRPGQFPASFQILDKPVPGGLKSSQPEASKEVYRPPGARGLTAALDFLKGAHDGEEEKVEDLSKSQIRKMKKKKAKSSPGEALPWRQKQATEGATPSKGGDDEAAKAKKVKKLNDKLFAIEKLKQKQKEGQTLEKEQLEKIAKESEILSEIQKLSL